MNHKAIMEGQVPEIKEWLAENDLICVDRCWGVFTNVDGVKIEWNWRDQHGLVIGHLNSDNDKAELKKLIDSNFETTYKKTTGQLRFHKDLATPEDFRTLIDLIQNEFDHVIETPNTEGLSVEVSFKKDGFFVTAAEQIQMAVEKGRPAMLDRAVLGFDQVDEFIKMGRSTKWTPINNWREHVVPCKMIIDHAVKMIVEGYSITEIATMISNNLKIIEISREEQRYLDHDLKLQTTMPDGWEFGDDIYARLKEANIKF